MLLPYYQSKTLHWLFPIPTHFSANNNAIFQVTELLFQSVCAVLERAPKIIAKKEKY
jgi:hypothetical protein